MLLSKGCKQNVILQYWRKAMFQGGEGEHFLFSFWGFDIVPYDICYQYSAQQVMDNS